MHIFVTVYCLCEVETEAIHLQQMSHFLKVMRHQIRYVASVTLNYICVGKLVTALNSEPPFCWSSQWLLMVLGGVMSAWKGGGNVSQGR